MDDKPAAQGVSLTPAPIRRRRLAAALLSIAVVTPGPAAALTGDCLWKGLPAATRDNVLVAYKTGGRQAVIAVPGTPDMAAVSKCTGGVPSDEKQAENLGVRVGVLATATKIERASAFRLAELGFSASSLDGAWSSLGPERRALLRSGGAGDKRAADPEAVGNALVDGAIAAGLSLSNPRADDVIGVFNDYFLARALRETWEAP
jgi:hypothetical protein